MDIRFKNNQANFEFRAAGVIIHQNRLLVVKDAEHAYYYLPGGAVNINEASANALKRELHEELGINAQIDRLLWVTEDFFIEDTHHKRYHHLSFYYLVNTETLPQRILANDFVYAAPEGCLHFYWKTFDEMQNLYFYPDFLRTEIRNLPQTTRHLILYKD